MPRPQWFRRTGWVAVKPMGEARHSRLKDERDWRLGRTAASPDPPLHGGVARKRLESARTGGQNAATRLDKASAPAMRRKTV